MDPKELQRELHRVFLEDQKLNSLFRRGQGDQVQLDLFEVGANTAKIAYTAYTHGGGSMVLGSLAHKLNTLPFQPKEILECFCGPGFFGFWSKLIFPEARLTLLDLNPKVKDLINITKKENAFFKVEFFAGDLFENCPPRKFDLILANPPWWPTLESDELKKILPRLKTSAPPLTYMDAEFAIHRRFFKTVKNFLHGSSQILMLESHFHGPELKELAEAEGFVCTLEPLEILQLHSDENSLGFPTWIRLKGR